MLQILDRFTVKINWGAMEQFVAVAVARFLALLIPGVDFFLIARTTIASGWRNATGACVGIATANGIFIAAAFPGLSLISHLAVVAVIQLAGGAFLIYIGVMFTRSNARFNPDQNPHAEQTAWAKKFSLGLASGLLNPKNALFYLSLAAALTGASSITLIGYGAWMFTIMLAWDVFVARGSRRVLARLERVVPWLTKIAGGFFTLLGTGMIISLTVQTLQYTGRPQQACTRAGGETRPHRVGAG